MGTNDKKMEKSFSDLLSAKVSATAPAASASSAKNSPAPTAATARKASRRYSLILPEEYNLFFCEYQSNKMRQTGEKCTDVQVILDALDALREQQGNK